MDRTGRRRLPAGQRRALIEDAAARLFAERGYEAARLEDIAAAAGVTKPMLYRHFASKQELYLAVLRRHRDALAVAALTPFVEGRDRPVAERVGAMIDAWYAHVEAHPHVGPLLFRTGTPDPVVRAALAEQHERQRAADMALFDELGADVPEELREPCAEAVRSSLTGLALWWADHPEVPRADVVSTMMRVVGAIAPVPGA